MPRISPRLSRTCDQINPFLRLLLPVCRTIERSCLELKWITQEISSSMIKRDEIHIQRAIYEACMKRSQLVPLQYVLGSQPFGHLDILCRSGVLIPRWETEEWSHELAQRIQRHITDPDFKFEIWDICSGSGCIALLMRNELCNFNNINITAVDCSQQAINLIKENMAKNKVSQIFVEKKDILKNLPSPETKIDILLCNPPYISKESFLVETSRSVRIYEPRLALIGDKEFYQNLVNDWLSNINSFAYEIGDSSQATFINDALKKDALHKNTWSVGLKYDSNNKPRVVYGFKKNINPVFPLIFENFGQIMD